MKVAHVLGHNSNWNVDIYNQQQVGDYFIITAFTHGLNFDDKNLIKKIRSKALLDLQFYGKNVNTKGGKLNEFPFHPCNQDDDEATNVYFITCVKQAIQFQINKKFDNVVIPLFYENEELSEIIRTIKEINEYVSNLKEKDNHRFFMTLPFANHLIIDKDKVEELLIECTDRNIIFDGYFITCENKPEFKKKLTTDIKIFRNLSRVFKTLKDQEFKTIYAYANWDALLYLSQTDIDLITVGSYENLRNFAISRFTEDISGGGSKGYYFSSKLMNMIKANDLTNIREQGQLNLIKNDKNIFSDIILRENFDWNIHKPDVNKNYLLAVTKLLKEISEIKNIDARKTYLLNLINDAIYNYDYLDKNKIYLDNESSNYHLSSWKTYLTNS